MVTRYVRLPCLEGDPGSTPGRRILTTDDSEDTEIASKSRNFEAFSRHLALARPIRQRLGPISSTKRLPNASGLMISLICAFLETKLVSVAAESELWGAYGRRMRREGDMSRIEIHGFWLR